MKTLITLLALLTGFNNTPITSHTNPVVILISSASTPDYIGEMRDYLSMYDLVLNVEKELWADYDELQEFAFTLTHKKNKKPMSFHFRFNELNKHQVCMIYPKINGNYGSILTDVSYLKSDLLDILVNMGVRKDKPILHRSYDKSGAPYRESIVKKDLEGLESELEETIALNKAIKADQTIGASYSGYAYTYNGEYIEDPRGIDFLDMTADVLIENLEENGKIINIWMDEPLERAQSTSMIIGQ